MAKRDVQVSAWILFLQDHPSTKCKFSYLGGSVMDLNLKSS